MEDIKSTLSELTVTPLSLKRTKTAKTIVLAKSPPLKSVIFNGELAFNPESSRDAYVYKGYFTKDVVGEVTEIVSGIKMTDVPFILKIYPSCQFTKIDIKNVVEKTRDVIESTSNKPDKNIIKHFIQTHELIYLWDVQANAKRYLNKLASKTAFKIINIIDRKGSFKDKLVELKKIDAERLVHALKLLHYPIDNEYDIYGAIERGYKQYKTAVQQLYSDSVIITISPYAGISPNSKNISDDFKKHHTAYIMHLTHVLYIMYKYFKVIHDDLHTNNILYNSNPYPDTIFKIKIRSKPVISYKTNYIAMIIDFLYPTNILFPYNIKDTIFIKDVLNEINTTFNSIYAYTPYSESLLWIKSVLTEMFYNTIIDQNKDAIKSLDEIFYPIFSGLSQRL